MPALTFSRRNRTDFVSSSKVATNLIIDLATKYNEGRLRSLTRSEWIACHRHFGLVILDLLASYEGDSSRYIGYSRGKENFVRGGAYWNSERDVVGLSHSYFLNAIDFLHTEGLIENHIASKGYSKFSSRIKATKKLISIFDELGLNWVHINVNPHAQAIFVKDENKTFVAYPDPKGFLLDDAVSNLKRINANLQSTLINLDISDERYEVLKRRYAQNATEEENEEDSNLSDSSIREPLEFSNRSLKRIFALNSFSNGGRFYGGWWQGVPESLRKHIEIEGLMTVEMDYSSIQPRILYAFAGKKPPADAYTIAGWDKSLRPLIKKAFNQLINSDETSKHPNQWHRFGPELEPRLRPEDWSNLKVFQKNKISRAVFLEQTGRNYSELLGDILEFHNPIKKNFFSQAWGPMQFYDSQIAELVMIKLLDKEEPITALPIHDSFIVRRGAEQRLQNAMEEAFIEVVGANAKIDRSGAIYDPPDGYVSQRIVYARDIGEEVKQNILTHTKSNMREYEWTEAKGPF